MDRELGKLEKGQKVWVKILEMSNASRGLDKTDLEQWIFEGVIEKIGRKYVTVNFGFDKTGRFFTQEKFNRDDDYKNKWEYGGADYKLYSTKREILDELESEKLYYMIKYYFESYNNNGKITLEQLKKIDKIINEE